MDSSIKGWRMESGNMILINGHEFTFFPGETILQVAQRNGIDIPTLCFMKRAAPTGACRICLVEVEGARGLVASCAMPAAPKMVVRTETPRVMRARRMNLELLLSSGHHNCLVQDLDMDSWTDFQLKAMSAQGHEEICPAYGDCRLQELAIKFQIKQNRFEPSEVRHKIENVNPLIVRDLSRCVLCGRCVQACNEVQVNNAISYGYRGSGSKIVAKGDRALKDSDCVFCGECVEACPVGALVTLEDFKTRAYVKGEKKATRTTCTYCGVGCQLYLQVRNDRVVEVTGVEEVGPNYGSLCVKGRFGYDFIHDPGRLQKPLIRENGKFREASWDEALSLVAGKLKSIKGEHGADSIGVLSSARITNEENYLVQKFTRAAIGTNNIDHCARL
jgi:predicted molibdopterin-dependent oxidoreductase YjgC